MMAVAARERKPRRGRGTAARARAPCDNALRQTFVLLRGNAMNEEIFNLSIRKFLKMVGVNSQREIEKAVGHALGSHEIAGTESFPAQVTLDIPGLRVHVKFDGEIKLQ